MPGNYLDEADYSTGEKYNDHESNGDDNDAKDEALAFCEPQAGRRLGAGRERVFCPGGGIDRLAPIYANCR